MHKNQLKAPFSARTAVSAASALTLPSSAAVLRVMTMAGSPPLPAPAAAAAAASAATLDAAAIAS